MDDKLLKIDDEIDEKIYLFRGQRVMLDSDLAEIYEVETKNLNRAVKRNKERFPVDFMFQLTEEEVESFSMRWQIGTASKRNVRYRPYVFTEHGAVMLASVLRSRTAIEASIQVVRAFVRIRTILSEDKDLADKIEKLERRVDDKFDDHDKQIAVLFEAIKRLIAPPKTAGKSIGFVKNDKKPKKNSKPRSKKTK